jgi:hypothetical protein
MPESDKVLPDLLDFATDQALKDPIRTRSSPATHPLLIFPINTGLFFLDYGSIARWFFGCLIPHKSNWENTFSLFQLVDGGICICYIVRFIPIRRSSR